MRVRDAALSSRRTARAWSRSFFQSQAKIDDRTQDAPPVDDRPHFRVSVFGRRIDLRYRHFAVPVSQADRLQQQVRLELVSIEPRLPPVDAWIAQQRGPKRPKPVRALGNAFSRRNREYQRVKHSSAEDPVLRHVTESAAAEIPRSLHEVRLTTDDRIEQDRNFLRLVLVVAGVDDQYVVLAVERVLEHLFHGGADAAIGLVPQDEDARIDAVERSIGRTVVGYQEVVRARWRMTRERPADLVALVIRKGGREHTHSVTHRPRPPRPAPASTPRRRPAS